MTSRLVNRSLFAENHRAKWLIAINVAASIMVTVAAWQYPKAVFVGGMCVVIADLVVIALRMLTGDVG